MIKTHIDVFCDRCDGHIESHSGRDLIKASSCSNRPKIQIKMEHQEIVYHHLCHTCWDYVTEQIGKIKLMDESTLPRGSALIGYLVDRIGCLGVSPRVERRLSGEGINWVGQLITMDEDQILGISSMGRKGLQEILLAMEDRGLTLDTDPNVVWQRLADVQGIPDPDMNWIGSRCIPPRARE